MKLTPIAFFIFSIFLHNDSLFSSENSQEIIPLNAKVFLDDIYTLTFKQAHDMFNKLDLTSKEFIKTHQKLKSNNLINIILSSPKEQFNSFVKCTDQDVVNYIKDFDYEAIMNSRSIEEHFKVSEQSDKLLNLKRLLSDENNSSLNNLFIQENNILLTKTKEILERLKKAEYHDWLKNLLLKDDNILLITKNDSFCSNNTIILNKADFFALGDKKCNLLFDIFDEKILTKEKFLLLADMPIQTLYKLSPHFCLKYQQSSYFPYIDYDYRIKYRYKKPANLSNIIQYSLKSCRKILPSIIVSLLYGYGISWCLPSLFDKIQDPLSLAENKRKELVNLFIKESQNSNVPNSEFLRLKNIGEVPFTYIHPILSSLYITSYVLLTLIVYNLPLKEIFFSSPEKEKKNTHFKYKSKKNLYVNTLFITCFALLGWVIPFMSEISVTVITAEIIFYALITAIINAILKLKIKTKTKVIDPTRPKLKELSMKTILGRYLNKMTQIIV